MFSISLMRYELDDIINEHIDSILVKKYMAYTHRLSKKALGEMFENLIKLSPEQLSTFRLEYRPRSSTGYAALYVQTTNRKCSTYIAFKNDDTFPPEYCCWFNHERVLLKWLMCLS